MSSLHCRTRMKPLRQQSRKWKYTSLLTHGEQKFCHWNKTVNTLMSQIVKKKSSLHLHSVLDVINKNWEKCPMSVKLVLVTVRHFAFHRREKKKISNSLLASGIFLRWEHFKVASSPSRRKFRFFLSQLLLSTTGVHHCRWQKSTELLQQIPVLLTGEWKS